MAHGDSLRASRYRHQSHQADSILHLVLLQKLNQVSTSCRRTSFPRKQVLEILTSWSIRYTVLLRKVSNAKALHRASTYTEAGTTLRRSITRYQACFALSLFCGIAFRSFCGNFRVGHYEVYSSGAID